MRLCMDRKRTANDNRPGVGQADAWLTHAVTPDAAPADFNSQSKISADSALRNRVSIRKIIPCNLLVKIGSSYVIAQKVHDISLVGAFVELNPEGLAKGDFIDIVIGFSCDQRQVEHQIAAEVTRIEAAGVGLRFSGYGNRTYTDLVNLLYAK